MQAGTLPPGHGAALEHGPPVVRPDDRIGLESPNGGGKSALVRAMVRAYEGPGEARKHGGVRS